MSKEFVAELFEMRSELIDSLHKNKSYDGIFRLLSQLYPDNAHFLYELLQNAEDAKASRVSFRLAGGGLEFTHDGRDFTDDDVDSITSIGNTQKKDDLTAIGKFGVGFKAVFSYTNTPHVYSDSFCFGISDMVCPINVDRPAELQRGFTRFDFLFDNPKKPKKDAFEEIRDGLNGFSSATLLFLHNIQTIRWEIVGDGTHSLTRQEVLGIREGLPVFSIESDRSKDTLYWLRLSAPCREEPAHPVSVALQLVPKKAKKGEFPFSLIPSDAGKLCIFFPADKEKTNLKFHIHAPFISTVDRASVPYRNPVNISLRDQLAQLLASSLPKLRDTGLLTSRLLEILPNSTDELGEFYEPFISSVIAEMQQNALVPTASGGYSVAEELARGPKRIRDFVTDEDLKFLSEDEYQQWAAGTFNPRAEQFLKGLGIPEWSVEQLVDAIESRWGCYCNQDNVFWLRQKDAAWIRSLYLCVADEDPTYWLKKSAIVLATDEAIKKPSDIVFKPEGNSLPAIDGISYVHPAILKGEKDEVQKIRSFLESLGVMELDEVHYIKSLLSKHYNDDVDEPSPSPEEHMEHVKRFVKYWKQTDDVDIFEDYLVVYSEEDDGTFCSAENAYVDDPLCLTGLACVFSDSKYLVSHRYESIGEDFLNFVKAVGVHFCVEPAQCRAWHNPKISIPAGSRETYTGRNEDYSLPSCLKKVSQNYDASLLIWEMMSVVSARTLKARYRPNKAHDMQVQDSQLVQSLSKMEWLPDKEGNFHNPAEMTEEDLPDEYIFDDSNGWLTAVGFGAQVEAEKFEQEETTKRLRKEGIDLSFEDLKALSEIPKADLHTLLDEYKARTVAKVDFPEGEPKNPERRKKKIEQRYQDDPEKKTEKRKRTVRVSGPTVDPREYLENLYTNDDGQLVCQMCRNEMPFKLRGGRYYCETVQLIDDFKKESRELYVALCPVCAAKYKTLVKNHSDSMQSLQDSLPSFEHSVDQSLNIHDSELPELSIRFVQTHLEDIHTVLACESASATESPVNIEALIDALSNILLGERVPLDILDRETGGVLIHAGRRITKTCIRKLAENAEEIEIDPSPIRIKIMGIIDEHLGRMG